MLHRRFNIHCLSLVYYIWMFFLKIIQKLVLTVFYSFSTAELVKRRNVAFLKSVFAVHLNSKLITVKGSSFSY